VYSSVQGDDRWTLASPQGDETSVAVKGPLRSNNLSAVLAAARAGFGVAILPHYVARESLADRSVVPVMADHGLPAQEVHAVFPSPKLVPSKVTSFIGFMQPQHTQMVVDFFQMEAPSMRTCAGGACGSA
jgi:DNA-binding transcriptional LysR family regulator